MVLQRDVATTIWGWTQPGKEVTVTLAGKAATGVADAQGKWLVRLGALPAGGPYTMTVTGPQTVEVRDVLLGDVWICSGQSNMQMSVGGSMNAKAEIAAATHPRIRFFSVPWAGLRAGGPQVMHTEPQETVAAEWEICSPETVGGFSAVGYFFARDLQKTVDVPMGLIRAAVGGSPITSWCAPSMLEGVPAVKPGLESLDMLRALIRENKIGETYFKGMVQRWWEENDAGTREGWFKPEWDTTGWRRLTFPAEGGKADVPRFHGIVWFRKEVDIPQDWAGKELSLYTTGIWEPDTTWFNGTVVGAFDQGWINRTLRVPAALVREGRNVIALRVLAQPGSGYQGPSAASTLGLPGSKPSATIPLGGQRFLRESTPAAKLPPFPHRLDNDFQLPTVLYNGMIAPLIPYAIKGTLWYQGETPCPGSQAVHRRLLTDMIADWRNAFRFPQFLVPHRAVARAGRHADLEPRSYRRSRDPGRAMERRPLGRQRRHCRDHRLGRSPRHSPEEQTGRRQTARSDRPGADLRRGGGVLGTGLQDGNHRGQYSCAYAMTTLAAGWSSGATSSKALPWQGPAGSMFGPTRRSTAMTCWSPHRWSMSQSSCATTTWMSRGTASGTGPDFPRRRWTPG